jgi:UDP-N-acetyl-D-mannosaminuronic acid dehydrogenase
MQTKFQTISVIGLGYIGLPTAAVFASCKIKVIGIDVNQDIVDIINQGQIHIIEPDLDIAVHTAVNEGYFRAATSPEPADAFLIAVPTPFKEGLTGSPCPNLDYIESASKSFAPVLKVGDLVILESTSPVGSTERMAAWLAEARPDLTFPQTHGDSSDIRIAHCPERVLPGQVLRELVQNDRVIGGMTLKCSEAATQLYKIFVKGDCILTNTRTAEMCKLAENSFRDVNIAFANELSMICDRLDINVWELIKLANKHPRVNILQPGPGVGGHCIAVDPWFIVSAAPEDAKLIHTARLVNDGKPKWVVEKFKLAVKEVLKKNPSRNPNEITVACFGIAYKPDIDDLRESASLSVATQVAQIHRGILYVVEPNIAELPSGLEGGAHLVNAELAIAKSDIVIFLVAHKQFKDIKLNFLESIQVIDACGITQKKANEIK